MKRLPRTETTGGKQIRSFQKSYGDNGVVAFRTQAEKDEIEKLENMRTVAGIIDHIDLDNFKPEQRTKIESFRDFRRHENRINEFKRKQG
jgi:hypothetical protein